MKHGNHTIHKHCHHTVWDNSLEPVISVKPGVSVNFEVHDASGGQLSPKSTSQDVPNLDFSKVNPVTGPVYVEGAEPGDTLEVEIEHFGTLSWGWTAIIPGFGLLNEQFEDPYLKVWDLNNQNIAQFADGIEIPTKPFPGTIGVALPEAGEHSVVPPRKNGGNMDIRHLTKGTRLLLPVWVEGALFSVGDTHAAQGDGEVCGTAIEAPMEIQLKFKLHKGKTIQEPRFITPGPLTTGLDEQGYYVTTGHSDDLMVASKKAVEYMIEHLSETYGLSDQEAYALSSVAVDLKISEIVDVPNYLVSAYLPQKIFK
ncbi:acetamidase/formamidase family protein [Alkalibacillus haloalkaliphilus]|uniref:acetamidase/formamidase family protein n=1 Tax=Alkalibacillus haloalkaliphilus TaxID=94136 RepID=UPI0029367DA0|nr:acetamidase/formamidase family protein [Alkalibacillus haloalkaliphilus]MDV2581392.1 acetamidase/formamidase family protein [Alkalibacillus haloalkaliphilus]